MAALRAETLTLVAATAQSPTTTHNPRTWEFVHHGTGTNAVYYRVDGTTAVAAASENFVLLPGERVQHPAKQNSTGADVSLICAGAETVTVAVIQ